MKKILCVLMVIVTLLCGCMNSPNKSIVISKADGGFDEKMRISSDIQHCQSENQEQIYTGNFHSTDNSVEFVLDIDTTVKNCDMPVVEVVPHYLSEADAQRVAKALFGNKKCYEKKPILAEQFSKREIQNKLLRWTEYANNDSIRELFGQESEFVLELIKDSIAYYTTELDAAPGDEINEECQWTFKDEAYYSFSLEDIASGEEMLGNNAIMATYEVGDVSYSYKVVTRNKSDYKLNMISVHLFGGTSPMGIDERIFTAHLCRTDEPTEEQINSISQKAEKMLEKMDLGSWQINQCTVQTMYYGDQPEYIVHINATPLLCGVAAAQQPELYNLNSDSLYASNYYMTNVSMNFSANGEILDFEMVSPIEIKEIINENVAVIEISELMEIAKTHLMHSDFHAYGIENLEQAVDEGLNYTVKIKDLTYNLLRIRVPNTEDAYYYVPGIILEGYEECTGKESNNLYYISSEPQVLIALNAIDGTIVELSNT